MKAVAVVVSVTDGGPVVGPTRGDLDRLVGFRSAWYGCLTRWSDTLFEVGDAVLCGPDRVACLPQLSLEAPCRRGWGSVYAALAAGGVDTGAAREVLAGYLPRGWWPVFAVDITAWPRPHARTSPRRGMCRVPDPAGDRRGRAVPGWAYQWVCQVSPEPDSWTAPADVVRIDPGDNANEVAAAQMVGVAGRLAGRWPGVVPVFCLDGGYCPITATMAVARHRDHPARVIVRIRRDRVFYAQPAARPPGTPGRHRIHGARFACADPATWPTPTAHLSILDDRYGMVRVQAWTGLHPRPAARRRWGRQATADARPGRRAPIVSGTVVRISLQHTPEPGPAPTIWLWTAGPDQLNLDLIWRAYLRRFGIEHSNRFVKQHLGWTTPAVRTPEQADRWTWIVVAAHTQIRLARPLVADQRLPWERRRPPATLTPMRVRRGFRSLTPLLPPVTRPPKPSRPGPGRPPGSRNRQPTTHHKVIIKGRRSRQRR
jgi:hypothetical protein